jgi:hypothetical protein
VAFRHPASQRIGTAIVAYLAAFALFAPSAAAQERSVVVAFVTDAEVLERTDLAVGRLIGTPEDVKPDSSEIPSAAPGQLVVAIGDKWIGMTGRGRLTSTTTRRLGLVAGADVAPTLTAWIEGRAPPISAAGTRDVAAVRALDDRLQAIDDRRLLVALALLLTVALLARRPATAALAVLWAPAMTLVAAALTPSPVVEMALIGPGSAALAVLMPRSVALATLSAVGGYALDVVLGSDLTVRSLLGPNPALGARFYGVGNELEAILPVLALIGVAALAPRRPALAFGATMAALAVIVGAGRFGADVGGVITIGVAGAVAVAWPLRGRRVALIAAVPVVALAALAAIDLATNADSHFSRTLDDPGTVPDVIGHRYGLAWDALVAGVMPIAIVVAAFAAVWTVRQHPMVPPVWRAALAGGLAGSVAGSLVNDSGPLLFVLGVALLTAGTVYVRMGATRTEAVQAGP